MCVSAYVRVPKYKRGMQARSLWPKPSQKMMIHIPELVLSVKGKITRLGVSPRHFFFFLRIAGPTRRPEKKGREAPRTEGQH